MLTRNGAGIVFLNSQLEIETEITVSASLLETPDDFAMMMSMSTFRIPLSGEL